MNYWLLKSEPTTYSWRHFLKEGVAVWDGVRNYQARNYLKNMKVGDLALFYHSNTGKEVVGIAKVVKEAYTDYSSKDLKWVAVDLIPLMEFKNYVKIEQIKADIQLKDLLLIKQSRLSVMPVSKVNFELICKMGL